MKIAEKTSKIVTLKSVHGHEKSFKLTDIVELVASNEFDDSEPTHYSVKLTGYKSIDITKEDYNTLKDYLAKYNDLVWNETRISYVDK